MTIQFTVIIISMAALPLIGVVCFHKAMIKKRLEGRPGAADSSMRHALWTFFHLKRPIRPADLPAHHMPIRSRAQTNTPRTLLSSCTLRRQSSKLFLKWYSPKSIYWVSNTHILWTRKVPVKACSFQLGMKWQLCISTLQIQCWEIL